MARRALLAASLMLLLGAADARACSCGGGDPRAALREADSAFTGRVLAIDYGRRGSIAIFTFRVDRTLKGSFRRRVKVRTPRGGPACGYELDVGDHAGLIVERRRGRWRGNLCAQYGARELSRAARGKSAAGRPGCAG